MAITALLGIAIAATIVAVALLGLRRWEAERGRSRAIRAAAKAHDFAYHESDNGVVGEQRFDIFMEGNGLEATNLVSSRRSGGRTLLAFDYQLIIEYEVYRSPDGSHHRRRKGESNTIGGKAIAVEVDRLNNRGSASVAEIGGFLRNVLVQPRGWAMSPDSRLPDTESFSDRPDQFAHIFMVRSDDDLFTDRFLTPKMMKFMAATGGRLGFEVRGGQCIVFAPEVGAEDMVDLAKLAAMWVDLFDPELLAEHPPIQTDSQGNPQIVVSSNTFPSIDDNSLGPGPVFPKKLSSWSDETEGVPVLSQDPQQAPPEPQFPEPEAATASEEPPAPKPVAAPEPAPESVDWSM